MIDRYSELTDTLKVLEEKHEEANEEQIEQITLCKRQLEGDTCSWKGQLERTRSWKVFSWKVRSWKLSLKLERAKRSWKDRAKLERTD